jgi:hypothetical protein
MGRIICGISNGNGYLIHVKMKSEMLVFEIVTENVTCGVNYGRLMVI